MWRMWLFVQILLTGISCLQAQDAVTPLTEAEAVRIALQSNPQLRSSRAEAEMAQARVGVARSEGTLQVSVNGLVALSTMENVLAVPAVMPQALLQSQDRGSLDLNGMAMYPLYTGGRIAQGVQVAQYTAEAVQSQVALTRVQIASAARQRYAAWQQATAMLAVAQSALTAQTESTKVIEQLYEAGKVPRFDLLRAQAAQASSQQQVANAQADVTASRALLAQTLGVTADTLPATASDETLATPPSDALNRALTRRPDLLSAQQQINAAQATESFRRAEYRPQVYAVGMVDALTPSDMGKNAGVTLGVVAGIPILNGGRRRAEISEAQSATEQARAVRDTLELQVRADVTAAEARVHAARANIDTATAQITAAEEAVTVAQERYNAGRGTVVELLDALRARTEARQNLVIAQTQYRLALANLYQAMGVE